MTNGRVVPFNPLDKRHLGESVAQAMLRRPAEPLAELEKFRGAGIYAIYYTGDFAAYEEISRRNTNGRFIVPIYVGKAIPSGARKGSMDLDSEPGRDLYERLKDHRKSVNAARNLDINHFYFRALVVDDIWIPLGESLLIAKFSPVWNVLVDGFGNHDPGGGRRAGLKPKWDVLHPGRGWAEKCRPREETQEQLIGEVANHLANNPPPDDTNLISY